MGGTPIGTGALPAVPYLRGSALSDLSGDRHGRGREPGDGDRLESFLPIHGNDVWLHALIGGVLTAFGFVGETITRRLAKAS